MRPERVMVADAADHPVTSGVPGGAAHLMCELTLTYDPDTRALQTDTEGAVAVIAG